MALYRRLRSSTELLGLYELLHYPEDGITEEGGECNGITSVMEWQVPSVVRDVLERHQGCDIFGEISYVTLP